MTEFLRVDFHCHTIYSPDSLSRIEDVIQQAHAIGLDRLVISDHNNIEGAEYAKSIDPELIIVGEEIYTIQGELLAIFVTEKVPENLSPMKAIERLRAQGAFISVSHPLDTFRGWVPGDLDAIAPYVDAIEIFNSRCLRADFNERAMKYALTHGIAGTVGSDAHMLEEIGNAVLTLPKFNSADELRQVIALGKAEMKETSRWAHLGSRYARAYKWFMGYLEKSK